MKYTKATSLLFTALLAGLLFTAGCSGSGEAASERPESNTISGEDAARTPTVRLADLIVQRVPGITLTQSGGGRIKVRVRGITSFTANNQPLFVVDDMPVDPEPDGSLPGVVLTEIESIKVYKDPADTSRWGMRGANGVIVVKTKMGGG